LPIDVRDEFLTLVKINSPSRKEGALAGYLKKRLLELGAEVYEDHSSQATGSDTGNIIATFPGDESKPVILLAAHMDTIGDTEGIEPLIQDGVIYSGGKTILGADDKAGIAVILGALSILQEEDAKTGGYSHGPIEVLLTVQEEVGLIGVKNLDYNLKSVFGYVLDADGPVGTIVNASPSNYNIDIVVEGKAAHAGVAPEKGINAIVVASEAIAGIHSGRVDEETTSNFGIISGGKARNIVADRVEIKAEVRSRNKVTLEREADKMIKKFEDTAAKYQAKLSYSKNQTYETFALSPKHEAISNAIKAGEKLGLEVTLKATGGGMDANILNTKGISCAALGLGNGNPHTNEEYVSIEEMQKAVQFVVNILKNED